MKDSKLKRELPLYAMLLVPVVIVIIFAYIPILGNIMAFENFVPSRYGFVYALLHSKFVGFNVYRDVLALPNSLGVVWNTFFIATMKIILKLSIPLVFALLLNEVSKDWFRKAVTTITYLPFFVSWVVLAGILLDFFSPQDGAFNKVIEMIGMKPTFFFGIASQFPYAVVLSDLWKEVGYNTIIFLAALTGVDVTLYEAAVIDGAGRWKQTLNVTLPSIAPIIVLVGILSLGNVLNAGQDQILNLYNPAVYSSGDIIDTFVFRQGIQMGQFSTATAVGLFKSVVSFVMISLSYIIANRCSDYRVF